MKRDLTDIDFAARGKQRKEVRAFLEQRGYVIDQDILVTTEGKRYFFTHPDGAGVDVFFDELFFCHPIPLRDRLDLDYPTITPTDLLLEKMQIVELNPKDIKDTIVLLLEHIVDESGSRESVDSRYIAKLLGQDWGFYYTVTTNLEQVRRRQHEYADLTDDQTATLLERLGRLERQIEEEPKSAKWKLRARIGPRRKWYQEVAEKAQTY